MVLADRRGDGGRPCDERLHVTSAGDELHLPEHLRVVGIGRDDAEHARLAIEEDREDAQRLGDTTRDHLDGRARDVGLRELLRGDEVCAVDARQRLEEIALAQDLVVDEYVLGALGRRVEQRDRSLVLGPLQDLRSMEQIDDLHLGRTLSAHGGDRLLF